MTNSVWDFGYDLCLIDALLELVAVLVGTSVCASFSVNAPTRVTRSVDSETGSDDGFAALRGAWAG